MQKLTLGAVAAVILAGCATAHEPTVSTYTYDSQEHSGTVNVTDKQYSNTELTCATGWREGEVYTPKGLIPMGRDKLTVSIKIKTPRASDLEYDIKDFSFDVPLKLGSRVFAKDYQVGKSFMLGAETNGMIQQGENFFYPDGYFIRVSEPSIHGWDYVSCIGIDHMYVLDADLKNSTNPPVYLDRVVVPFVMDQDGQPVTVSFGSQIHETAEIRVSP